MCHDFLIKVDVSTQTSEIDWNTVSRVLSSELDQLLIDCNENDHAEKREEFSFQSHVQNLKCSAPNLFSVLLSLISGKRSLDETMSQAERSVGYIVAILMRQTSRRSKALAFPTQVSMLMLSHGTSKQVHLNVIIIV